MMQDRTMLTVKLEKNGLRTLCERFELFCTSCGAYAFAAFARIRLICLSMEEVRGNNYLFQNSILLLN